MSGDRIHAVLVDDEPLSRMALRQALAPHRDIEVLAECRDGDEALTLLARRRPDLLFLDIHMPGLDGFQLLEALEDPPLVVFTTAYDQHALRAFEAQALDYLLKPLDAVRVDQALAKVRVHLRGRRATPGACLHRLVVRRGDKLIPLRLADVEWIGAEGNYVALHVGDATYLHRESLGHLEARLEPGTFLRVHRGLLVNRERVRELLPGEHGDARVRLHSGAELPLSRRFKAEVRQSLARA